MFVISVAGGDRWLGQGTITLQGWAGWASYSWSSHQQHGTLNGCPQVGGCLLARDVWYFLSDRGSLTVRRIADQLSSSTHGGWLHSAALNSWGRAVRLVCRDCQRRRILQTVNTTGVRHLEEYSVTWCGCYCQNLVSLHRLHMSPWLWFSKFDLCFTS